MFEGWVCLWFCSDHLCLALATMQVLRPLLSFEADVSSCPTPAPKTSAGKSKHFLEPFPNIIMCQDLHSKMSPFPQASVDSGLPSPQLTLSAGRALGLLCIYPELCHS